jgi:tRNA-splicing ligase RtcB
MWADKIDELALQQARNLASLPFAYSHIALMPDVHCGLGMPIGGVLATKGIVVPNAVGVDIGCGMCAIKTSLRVEDVVRKRIVKVLELIRQVIPLGFDHHKVLQDESLLPEGHDIDKLPCIKNLITAARYQIGTLGGGNHFIEIQKSSTGEVWVMIHSGSRNVGKLVAEKYGKIAKKTQ